MSYDYTSGSWGDKVTGFHAKTLSSVDPDSKRKDFSA
jgi:hypothetical protein